VRETQQGRLTIFKS